jgi:hypothetical protein
VSCASELESKQAALLQLDELDPRRVSASLSIPQRNRQTETSLLFLENSAVVARGYTLHPRFRQAPSHPSRRPSGQQSHSHHHTASKPTTNTNTHSSPAPLFQNDFLRRPRRIQRAYARQGP